MYETLPTYEDWQLKPGMHVWTNHLVHGVVLEVRKRTGTENPKHRVLLEDGREVELEARRMCPDIRPK